MLASLNKKKVTFLTFLDVALKALTLALEDSAAVFVLRLIKKFRMEI